MTYWNPRSQSLRDGNAVRFTYLTSLHDANFLSDEIDGYLKSIVQKLSRVQLVAAL